MVACCLVVSMVGWLVGCFLVCPVVGWLLGGWSVVCLVEPCLVEHLVRRIFY